MKQEGFSQGCIVTYCLLLICQIYPWDWRHRALGSLLYLLFFLFLILFLLRPLVPLSSV
jgi:hypothetical protein